MTHHSNITAELIDDDYVGILIEFDAEDCKIRIRSDVVYELVEKLSAHRQHPQVAELMGKLSKLVRGV
jgi:hypothetical protein